MCLVMDKADSLNISRYSLDSVILTEDGNIDSEYDQVKHSTYALHLERWLKHFSRSQMFITESEEVVNSPVSVLRELETFLGIGHVINEDYLVFNETRGFYCMRDVTYDPRMVLVNYNPKRIYPVEEWNPEVHCLGSDKGRPHPDIGSELYSKLHDFFIPRNLDFFNLRN